METEQVRSEELKIYLTPEEKETAREIARSQERTLSSWGRVKILEEIQEKVEAV